MTAQEVIEKYGTQAEAARELDLTYQCVSAWVARGYIPLYSQYRIEVLTKGALKADKE